jgi:hypothetical protein
MFYVIVYHIDNDYDIEAIEKFNTNNERKISDIINMKYNPSEYKTLYYTEQSYKSLVKKLQDAII